MNLLLPKFQNKPLTLNVKINHINSTIDCHIFSIDTKIPIYAFVSCNVHTHTVGRCVRYS